MSSRGGVSGGFSSSSFSSVSITTASGKQTQANNWLHKHWSSIFNLGVLASFQNCQSHTRIHAVISDFPQPYYVKGSKVAFLILSAPPSQLRENLLSWKHTPPVPIPGLVQPLYCPRLQPHGCPESHRRRDRFSCHRNEFVRGAE